MLGTTVCSKMLEIPRMTEEILNQSQVSIGRRPYSSQDVHTTWYMLHRFFSDILSGEAV